MSDKFSLLSLVSLLLKLESMVEEKGIINEYESPKEHT
ncbi:hypothetical protein MNB_SM-4-631 [hydrothermal vent metagenome]|uniref:Uncharacterized protein n=1 Tax=hydrothermal vent metagenome TaxID=652676 RepID=A0A1W1B9H5_9ZZZZ